jgi:hypothetical protein
MVPRMSFLRHAFGYSIRLYYDQKARYYSIDRAGLSGGAGADPQAVHLYRGRLAGGVYLWKTRADAVAFYSGPWLAGIRERYGMDPRSRISTSLA